MRIAISGATGLIGGALAGALDARGDTVHRLDRRGDGPYVWADPAEVPDLTGVDAVVHLAGEPVAEGRWTDVKKARILDSRVDRTHALAKALAAMASPPALICASAVGYYGADAGDAELTEASPPGDGFLAEVCVAWEAACAPATAAGVRVANTRIGIVLSPEGGALAKMLPIFKLGLGGPLGGGDQYMSWISLPDIVRAFIHLIDHDLQGAFNFVSPAPCTNKAFGKALGKALGRPAFMPAPAFAIKLAFGGQMASQTVLAGQRALPNRLIESGFTFEHMTLASAFEDVLAG